MTANTHTQTKANVILSRFTDACYGPFTRLICELNSKRFGKSSKCCSASFPDITAQHALLLLLTFSDTVLSSQSVVSLSPQFCPHCLRLYCLCCIKRSNRTNNSRKGKQMVGRRCSHDLSRQVFLFLFFFSIPLPSEAAP